MITYIGRKDSPIEFEGNELDAISGEPEEIRAIVLKDNGRFAVAYYCFHRFGTGAGWGIWTDDEYSSQFKALMALGLATQYSRRWVICDSVHCVP